MSAMVRAVSCRAAPSSSWRSWQLQAESCALWQATLASHSSTMTDSLSDVAVVYAEPHGGDVGSEAARGSLLSSCHSPSHHSQPPSRSAPQSSRAAAAPASSDADQVSTWDHVGMPAVCVRPGTAVRTGWHGACRCSCSAPPCRHCTSAWTHRCHMLRCAHPAQTGCIAFATIAHG
jgi:hypothetical protein